MNKIREITASFRRHGRLGLFLSLAAVLSQTAVPLFHGWHVAIEEAALPCHGVPDDGRLGITASDHAKHSGHHHHDPNHCPVEQLLSGGGPLLTGKALSFDSSPVFVSSLSFSFGIIRTTAPDLSGRSPRGPPLA